MIKKDKGYVRVSTKYESQKDSPAHQESFIREVAGREGIVFGKDDFYEDRDSATTIVEREDVQRMIEDAKRGETRSIWFASLSRFSRDALDAITLKRILVNALKVRLVSIEDGYDSADKDDELVFGVRAVVNQNTSGDIGGASRRGIRISALEEGNFIGTFPPFGLNKIVVDEPRNKSGKRKSLERREDQAPIVELMYDLYIDHGYGDKAIVNYLNGENPNKIMYPSYNGGLWTLSSVRSILTNPYYTGYNIYGRYASETSYDDLTNLMKRSKKLVLQPVENWEWSRQIFFPVIIPLARWNIAQEIRLTRGGGKRGGRRKFLNVFAKFIFCKDCGTAMVYTAPIVRGKEYPYLICSRRRRVGEIGCKNNKWIPYLEVRDKLIDQVIKRMRDTLDRIEKGTKSLGVTMAKNNFDKEKRKLEKRIGDNRKLLFEIRRQSMLGEVDAAQYEFEKEQYEKEISESEERLKVIVADERKSLDVEKLVNDAKNSLRQLSDLKSYDDVEKTRALLMQTVKRIEVDHNGHIVMETYL